jgi:serine/threonine-protein kinase
MLSERYRIVGLLGRGGMGEVYRADDLKLGQTVALKFLPPELDGDAERLQLLLAEVRHARQVSHPNICRVYDIGEVGGSHFIAMEFVDGEDLASLMRRIGHLPADKATQVARQICAGIAAAHVQGILHRDLKPANIMLDGRGRARITDFGLALAAGDGSAEQGNVVGTPAYMAPEQILTGTATSRSDIYALGLILHELFTGRRVFAGADFAMIRAQHLDAADSISSRLSGDLDPAVERVVARCLARDPRDRPSSALQVAAALPGGDPLAAALAAGETPSPELVASATTVGAMPMRVAIACMVGAIALFAGFLAFRSRDYAAFTTPITTLSLRAEEILHGAGVSKPPRHAAQGFTLAPRIGAAKSAKTGTKPEELYYWRRWSPTPMVPRGIHRMAPVPGDPGHEGVGSAMVVLDRGGRLVALDLIVGPDLPRDSLASTVPADSLRAETGIAPFGPFLAAAGFDTTRLVAVPPRRTPGVYAARIAAWHAEGDTVPSRDVEAGAVGRTVVHFALTDSVQSTAEIVRSPATPDSGNTFADWINALFFSFGATAATVFLARRNLLAGRGDRRGATRLAIFVLAVNLLESVFTHPLGQRGVPSLLTDLVDGRGIGHSLLHAVTMWFAYVAIEPYVRRLWPDMLVGWARLVSGRVRDPLVGRDVVIGGVAGLALCLVAALAYKGVIALGWLAPREFPESWALAPLGSMGVMAYGVVWSASVSVLNPLWTLVWVLLVHFAVRQRTWSAVIAWGLSTAVAALTATEPGTLVPTFIDQGLANAVLLFILVRWGLLAGIVAGFVVYVISAVPATLDLSAWYIDRTALGVGVVAVLMAWGFKNAIAGQTVFHDPLAEKRPSHG